MEKSFIMVMKWRELFFCYVASFLDSTIPVTNLWPKIRIIKQSYMSVHLQSSILIDGPGQRHRLNFSIKAFNIIECAHFDIMSIRTISLRINAFLLYDTRVTLHSTECNLDLAVFLFLPLIMTLFLSSSILKGLLSPNCMLRNHKASRSVMPTFFLGL